MNTSYLPSKKIWILIGIILVIAAGVYLFVGGDISPSSLTSNSEQTEQPERLDTDNDGLEDWEEALWNTDPENPDTDGDGVEDGAEVEEGTHPKIAGPNDEIDQRRVDAVYNQEAEAPKNISDEVWKELLPYMASYISVTGGDKEISDARMQEISEEIAQEAEAESGEVERRSREDLNINTDVTFEALDNYFIQFIKITGEYSENTDIDNELLIFAQATAGDELSEEDLVGLEVIATDYRALANDLQQVSVPENLTSLHLELINTYLGLAQATENMSALQDDPVRALVGLKKYRELMHTQQDVANDLGDQIGEDARSLLESE